MHKLVIRLMINTTKAKICTMTTMTSKLMNSTMKTTFVMTLVLIFFDQQSAFEVVPIRSLVLGDDRIQ